MPAEWEPHAATWLAWPHNRRDWPGKFAAIPLVFADIVRWLGKNERVEIIVENAARQMQALRSLAATGVPSENLSFLSFHHWPTDRVWMRDSCPIFLRRRDSHKSDIALLNWKFNAWAKYSNWKRDDRLPTLIASHLRMKSWQPHLVSGTVRRRVVLEGGSIDGNGQGALLTTEECLLGKIQERNPGMERQDYERVFRDFLGVSRVIWLGQGIEGDDTHGHVDDLARFVSVDTIVTMVETNSNDRNYSPLQENLRRLRAARDNHGKKFQVIEMLMPGPVVFKGQRLPASYANFYLANHIVLVPTFNHPNDRRALQLMADLFPEREVVGVHCVDLIWGFGAIHCITQQQPA